MSNAATLTEKTQSTDFWQWNGWSVQVKSDQQNKTLRQRRPFALVGSHHCCHLRVSSRSVPEIAYFLCCFEDRVEAWPLPNHGEKAGKIICTEQPFSVGPCELSFQLDTELELPSSPSREFEISIEVLSDRGDLQKSLAQGVHLLSADAHDLKPTLEFAATHAAINQGGSLWIVDLSARKMRRSERIRRLSLFENEYTIGHSILAVTDIIPSGDNTEDSGHFAAFAENPLAETSATDHSVSQEKLLTESKDLLFDSKACLNADPEVGERREKRTLNADNYPKNAATEAIAQPLLQRFSGVISMLSEFTGRESCERTQATFEEAREAGQTANPDKIVPSHQKDRSFDQIQSSKSSSTIHLLEQFAPIEGVVESQPSGGDGMNGNSPNSKQNDLEQQNDHGNQGLPSVKSGIPQDQWFTSFAVGEGLSDAVTDEVSQIAPTHNPNNRHSPLGEPTQLEDTNDYVTDQKNLEIHCDVISSNESRIIENSDPPGQAMFGNSEQRNSEGTDLKKQKMHQVTPATSIPDPIADASAFVEVSHQIQGQGDDTQANQDNYSVESNHDLSRKNEEVKNMESSTDYTDMSSFSFVPNDEEPQQQFVGRHSVAEEKAVNPVQPPPVEPSSELNIQRQPSDSTAVHNQDRPTAFRKKVRSLSDYKIDPDELTTEISVRLANHVAPKRGFLSAVRRLFVVTTIIAVHVAVFYFVGQRVYELISATP